MRNIQSLLERFAKALNRDGIAKSAVVDVVRTRARVTLTQDQVSFKDGVLKIEISSAVAKNEIRLKEEGIMDELRGLYKLPVRKILYA